MSLFLFWFPVRLRRNVVFYIAGILVWTLSRSIGVQIGRHWVGNYPVIRAINTIETAIVLACLLLWLLGMNGEGERRTALIGHRWNRDEAVRLTGRLEVLNQRLERVRRHWFSD